MLTLDDKCRAVTIAAFAKLPRKYVRKAITSVQLADLGAHNGVFYSLSGKIELNYRLFEGGWDDIPLIDDRGNFNPKTNRVVSRALHTTIHEFAHAIGEMTGLDETPEWMSISGWLNWPYEEHPDIPPAYGRYIETRPGWEEGPSDWVFKKDAWFTREYGSKSPFEDFADCCALKALGWESTFGTKHGLKKLHYLERRVWGEDEMTKGVLDKHVGMVLSAKRSIRMKSSWTSNMNCMAKALKSNGRTPIITGNGLK